MKETKQRRKGSSRRERVIVNDAPSASRESLRRRMKQNKDDMSHILQTPQECLLHAKVQTGRGRLDLAALALKRAFDLMAAEKGGGTSEIERKFWRTIYALEHAREQRWHQKRPAGRIRQMEGRWGAKETIERVVTRCSEQSAGYRDLLELGLKDLTFEEIVLEHRDEFSSKALALSLDRHARYSR
jgi:hypothetical protein